MSISRTLKSWRNYRSTVTELNRLSQRELADLGVSRVDIPDIVRQATR